MKELTKTLSNYHELFNILEWYYTDFSFLDFSFRLKNMQNKVNRTIGLLHKLQNTLSRTSLITLFNSFIRPHLDYGDITYDRERFVLSIQCCSSNYARSKKNF